MALTPEERQQMELCFAKQNHGFRFPSYPGIDLTHMTLADYERLWETPFADYMHGQGIDSIDKAKSNNDIRPYIEGILGLLSLNDGAGKIYDYVVDTLYGGTMGQIISRKDEVVEYLNQQDKEMTSDYEEDWGAKKKLFLRATHYTSDDGDEKGYFFRFWRDPASKILAYRNINLSTPEGRQSATDILTDLFGPNARTYQPEDLMTETPEHLVEQREEIERQKREAQQANNIEKQRLMDQPFHEMLAFSGIHFSDTTDTLQMGQEAFANPDAHRILSDYCASSDPFDALIFDQVITLTPNQIRLQSASLKSALMDRTDDKYLADHPEATFENFLKNRRGKASPTGDMESREKVQQALQKILGTTVKLDDQTLQEALSQKCADLTANASKIIQTNAKRKKRKMIALVSSISALSAFLILGLYKGTQLAVEGANALGDKMAEVSHTTQEKAQKWVDQVKSNHTERVESASTTNNTPQSSESESATSPFPLKGNRPVSGAFWKGWRDYHGRKVEPMALQLAITGEFNHLLEQMKKDPNATIMTVSHPEKTAGNIMASYPQWQPATVSGQTPIRFYIAKTNPIYAADNKTNKENLIRDIVNYHLNLQDALNNIPVPTNQLATAQVQAMEALGPTMGWSIYQQLSWAKNNPTEMQSAQSAITRGATGILTAQKADKSDIAAVFKATCLSIKSYRDTHPDIQSYLLLAQQTVHEIAGLKAPNLTRFQHFQASDLEDSTPYLERVSHIKPASHTR